MAQHSVEPIEPQAVPDEMQLVIEVRANVDDQDATKADVVAAIFAAVGKHRVGARGIGVGTRWGTDRG